MQGTNVFATEEEAKRLRELADKAANTPVILLFGKHDLAGDALKEVQHETHACALAHGLPEIKGFYGLDAKGEFVTA